MRVSRPVMVVACLVALAGGRIPTGSFAAGPPASRSRPAPWMATPITIEVDAREAPRKLLHARLTIPVAPGPLTLLYPQWLPGEHGPTGPIADLAGLTFTTGAGGKALRWKRDSVDFYPEGELLWLEADTIIRRETGGAKSLDDFCRLFFGGTSGPPQVVPYTLDDVVAALQRVAPFDWGGFWRKRLEETPMGAPLGGVAGGGWKLTYEDTVPQMLRSRETVYRTADLRYSIGVVLAEDGRISDVIPGSPADRSGAAPGMKLVAVNGRRFSREVLREAIRETKTRSQPAELLLENGEFFSTHRLEYDGGERYPRITRDPATADLISEIIRPRAAVPIR